MYTVKSGGMSTLLFIDIREKETKSEKKLKLTPKSKARWKARDRTKGKL